MSVPDYFALFISPAKLRQPMSYGSCSIPLKIQIHQGLAPREAMQKYDQPVYINRRYADILIPAGENPVGQLVSRYDKSFQNVLAGDPKQACTICGIVSDLYINTLEEEAMPSLIYLNNAGNQHYRTLYVRLNEKQKKEGNDEDI